MVNQFSSDLLTRFIAPEIDDKPELVLPSLSADFEASGKWMQQYFLSSVFQGEFTGHTKLYVESIIARIQIVFSGYESARIKTMEYTAHWRSGSPGIGRYLAAVGEWESVFLNIQIVLDLMKKFLSATISAGDKEDRIRLIANRIKHVSEDIEDGKLTDTGMPLWLTPIGFATVGARVSCEEIVAQVRFLAQFAACLSLPSQAKERFAALDAAVRDDPDYVIKP